MFRRAGSPARTRHAGRRSIQAQKYPISVFQAKPKSHCTQIQVRSAPFKNQLGQEQIACALCDQPVSTTHHDLHTLDPSRTITNLPSPTHDISIARIAATIGRNRSTISRELKRNSVECTGHQPALAHAIARKSQCDRRNASQISQSQWDYVHAYLRLGLSPQQCTGRFNLEGVGGASHDRIYQWIYQDKAQARGLI